MKTYLILCFSIVFTMVTAQKNEYNYLFILKEKQDSSLLIDHGLWINNTFILSNHEGEVYFNSNLDTLTLLIEGEDKDTLITQKGKHLLYCTKAHELELFEVHHQEEENNHIHQEVNYTDIADALAEKQEIAIISTGPQIKKPMHLIFTGSDLLITQRNTRLNGQDWGMDHAPEMDFSSLESLEYLGNVERFQYTLKPGGAIITQGKEAPFHQNLGMKWANIINSNPQGINSALSLYSGFKKGVLENFAWEARASGVYQANAYTPEYVLSNTARKGYNYGASLFFHLHELKINLHYDLYQNQIGLPSFAHVGNLTDLAKAYQRGHPINPQDQGYKFIGFYQDILHETVNLEVKYSPKKKHLILFNASRQFDQRKEFDEDITPELDLRLSSYVLNTTWKNYLAQGPLVLGAEYIYKSNTYKGRYFIPYYKEHEWALFSYKEWKIKKQTFRLGGRLRNNLQNSFPRSNNFSSTSINYWSYAIGMDYELALEKHQWSFNLSYQSYAPNLIQLYSYGIHHGAQAFEEGNLALNNQELVLLKWGDEIAIHPKIKLSWGMQAGYFFNAINLRPQGKSILTVAGAYPLWSYENETAYMAGGQLKLRYEIKKGLLWESQLQYIRSESGEGKVFPFNPPFQSSNLLKYDWELIERHLLSWNIQWQYFGNAMMPTTLGEISYYTTDYSLFNLGMNYKFTSKKENTIYWGVKIQNIFNQTYRNPLNRLHPFSWDIGRNIQVNFKIEI